MQNIKTKLQKVYLPFLIVSIGTILFYYGFRWLFDIQLGILTLKESLLDIWIPFVLPWIPVHFWLRRRIRILNIRGKNDNGYFVYHFAIVLIIAITTIISQMYLTKSSYNLQEIDAIYEIEEELNDEKYFKINHFKLQKKFNASYITTRTKGRNGERIDVSLFIALPFQNSRSTWYGIEYTTELRSFGSDQKREAAFQKFIKDSERKFKTYDFKEVTYFEKVGYSDDRDGYIKAIQQEYPKISGSDEIILIPKKTAFNERLKSNFPWIFASFGIGAFIFLLMVIFPKIDEKELDDFIQNKPIENEIDSDFSKYFNPFGEHKAIAILLLANTAAFLIMVFMGLNIMSPTAQELLEIGGNRRTEVLNGEFWRLVTSTFIHGGFMHLFMNLVGIGVAGSFLEKTLGITRLLVIYFVCGIVASMASIFWYENTVSVGASGAIFGLFGVMIAFILFKIYPKYMHSLLWQMIGLFGGLSLLFGLISGADNAAHIGGLICGFLIGIVLYITDKTALKHKEKEKEKEK